MILGSWIQDALTISLTFNAPCKNIQAAHTPLTVNRPNRNMIQSSHTSELMVTFIPTEARNAYIIHGLAHHYLMSVGQLCDSEYEVTFSNTKVVVSHGWTIQYT
jgi:hypothetical protein